MTGRGGRTCARMGTSSVQIIDHPHGKIAQVRGVIDGTFDLHPLLGDHEIVLFDLEGVSRITSFGVREWRTALRHLGSQYLCFVGCRPSVVSQFNLVPGFACGGELISFYLPYVCPACNHVAEELLDLRADETSVDSLEPPPVRCARCGEAMEFDDIPAAYFKYARSVPRPRPPAAASAMIDDRAAGGPRRDLSVKKEVEDTVTAFWLSGWLGDRRALRRLTEGVEGQVVVMLNDLDGASDEGLAGLSAFLRAVGESYLCRVPAKLLAQIDSCAEREQLDGCRLISVDARLTCAGCGTATDVELDAALLAVMLEGRTAVRRCPSCARPLDADAIPAALREQLAQRPLTEPPEAVRIYRANRSGTRAPGVTQTYTAPSGALLGNYRILRRLGEGGMGEVLLARYVGVDDFEKLVVLKRVSRDYVRTPGAMQEFQREAKVTARLSHPNIVQIFDFNKFDDEYFFAMEYVNGIDLRRALRLCSEADLRWPANLCMRVISDVCAGLAAAHGYRNEAGVEVPIYHRDVSPENVIISVDGAVKLTDFGIAKAADSSVKTASGVFKGKHAYSAPEQLEDGSSADHRTDIYATGIVMYELLSLRRYLGDEPTLSMAYAAARKPPPQLAKERDDLPEGLQQIFEHATAADKTARFQTALEFRDRLEQLMKKGDYASSHDLAAWIRRVIALDRADDGAIAPTASPGDTVSEGGATATGRTVPGTRTSKANRDG